MNQLQVDSPTFFDLVRRCVDASTDKIKKGHAQKMKKIKPTNYHISTIMRTQFFYLAVLIIGSSLVIGCASEEGDTPTVKKAALEQRLASKKAAAEKASFEAKEIEKELLSLDPKYKEKLEEKKWRMVSAKKVGVKDFEQLTEFQGTVETKGDFMLSSEIGGTVVKMNVKEGDRVKAGQPLARVDDQALRRSMDELETSLRFARDAVIQRQQIIEKDKQAKQNSIAELETSILLAQDVVNRRRQIMDQDDVAKRNSVSELETSIRLAQEVIDRRRQIIAKDNEAKDNSMAELETSIRLAQDVIEKQRQLKAENMRSLQSNLEELKLAKDLAQDIFDRRKKLWDQNIGSEIEFLQAKNNLESIKKKIEGLESQIKQAETGKDLELSSAISNLESLQKKKVTLQSQFDLANQGSDLELTSAISNLESLQKKKKTVESQIATANKGSDLELATAISNVESLQQKKQTLQSQIAAANQGSDLELDKARVDVENLETKKAALQDQMKKTVVYAPAGGIVDQVMIKQGEMAGPGMPVVMLINTSKLQVKASVPESYLATLERNAPVKVSIPALETTQDALISNIGELINPNNRTIDIEVAINNPDRRIKPNLMAMVQLREYAEDQAVVVPTNYILNATDGDYLFVVEKQGKKEIARKVNITTGVSSAGETIVTAGLKGGEEIVTEGSRMVNDGDPIKVVR